MKRIITVLTVLCLLFSAGAFAFADNVNTSTITLSAEAAYNEIFSFTVPTVLAASVDKYGRVTTGNNAKIENKGNVPIQVDSVTVSGSDGWTYVNQDPVGSNEFSMGFESVLVNSTIAPGSDLPFKYSLKVNAQDSSFNEVAIGTAVFTISKASVGTPEAYTGDTVTDARGKYWYPIAKCGMYTLLLRDETWAADESFALPDFNGAIPVTCDCTNSISVPVYGAGEWFSLSSTEFTDYVADNETLKNTNGYSLRNGYSVAESTCAIVNEASNNIRPAVWVIIG